jgi:hypothetical protein
MKMGINLEASLAKIDRAEQHLKELESELHKLQDVAPFEVSIGGMDADRVVPVTVSLREFGFAPISMIAGDFIQNLRASLDYVVAAAAEVTPGVNVMSCGAASRRWGFEKTALWLAWVAADDGSAAVDAGVS